MSSLAYVALWLFVFTLPWETTVVLIPGVGVITKAMGGLAVAGAVAVAVTSGRLRRWQSMHVAGLLFVVWATAQLLFFHGGDKLPNKYFTFLQLFAMMWILWELSPSWTRQLGLLTAYVFGAYVAALGTVLEFVRHGGSMRRFASGETDPNTLASTMALALPMAWYLGLTYRRPLLRWVCRGYLAIGLVGIALTGSRGGMLSTMVALLIVPVTMTRLPPGRLAAAIGMLGISGALAVAYVPDTIVERLATTGESVQALTLGGRFRIWEAAVVAASQRPLAGYGTGAFRAAVTPWLGAYTQAAHNSFLSVLVEEGLVGLLLYLFMFFAVLRAAMELPVIERRFALVLLTTLFVTMMPLTWEDQKVVWFILAALLGLARAARVRPNVAPRSPVRAAPIIHARTTARTRDPLVAPVQNTNPDATP